MQFAIREAAALVEVAEPQRRARSVKRWCD